MRVKNFIPLILIFIFVASLLVSVTLVIKASTLSEEEIIVYLEDFHSIKVEGLKKLSESDAKDVYLVTTDTGVEFHIEIKESENGKEYVAVSSYNQQADTNRYLDKLKTLEEGMSKVGFTLYTGGEKLRIEDDPNTPENEYRVLDEKADIVQPISIGVDSEGAERIGISLLYEKPLDVFAISEDVENFWLVVQMVKSLEYTNPYITLRGIDGEFTSGKLIITDLEQLKSQDDLNGILQNSLVEAMGDLPSITVDEEVK